jgi:hypothetical protein
MNFANPAEQASKTDPESRTCGFCTVLGHVSHMTEKWYHSIQDTLIKVSLKYLR